MIDGTSILNHSSLRSNCFRPFVANCNANQLGEFVLYDVSIQMHIYCKLFKSIFLSLYWCCGHNKYNNRPSEIYYWPLHKPLTALKAEAALLWLLLLRHRHRRRCNVRDRHEYYWGCYSVHVHILYRYSCPRQCVVFTVAVHRPPPSPLMSTCSANNNCTLFTDIDQQLYMQFLLL